MLESCVVYKPGLVPYEEALEIQDRVVAEVKRGDIPAALLLLEHPHTFTFGRRGRKEHLIWDTTEIDRQSVDVHWVDRGGDVTYHGPGQIVGYPILPLTTRYILDGGDHTEQENINKVDYIRYLRDLEEVIILALAELNVRAERLNGATGVWVQRGQTARQRGLDHKLAKIAAIGVKIDAKGISKHGFALNVNPDMRYWEGIIACGLTDYPVTSLAEIMQPIPAKDRIIRVIELSFGKVFNFQMLPGDRLRD